MRVLAYHTGPITHLDHLGVLAAEMGIPLVTSDPLVLTMAKNYYPGLSIILIDENASLSFLNDHCDALICSGKFLALELRKEFELLFGKKIRIIFSPHGNSDKGRSLKPPHPPQDIALLYGKQMYDLWNRTGVLKTTTSIVFTGNYRLPYYERNKLFYKELLDPIFNKLSPEKKTIFYAPTWPDKENPSPFFHIIEKLILSLKKSFNLIIKLHPFLKEHNPVETYLFLKTFEQEEGILILDEMPLVYPFLERSAIYLGDYSSIGYDALYFDLSLYFLNNNPSSLEGCSLIPMGTTIDTSTIETLAECIHEKEKNRKSASAARKKLIDYCFEPYRGGREILKDIENASPL